MVDRKSKRGMVLWWTFVKAVPAFLVFSFLFYGAATLATSDYFFKVYLSRDLAALTEAVQAVPGEMDIFYPTNLSDFMVEIEGKTVKVSTAALDPTDAKKKFTLIRGYNYDVVSRGDSYLYFRGPPNKLEIKGEQERADAEEKFSCPLIDTADTTQDKTLVLDPGVLDNADELYAIANFILMDSEAVFIKSITRPKNALISTNERLRKIDQTTSIVLGLRSYINPNLDSPQVSIFISSNARSPAKNLKMACLIQTYLTGAIEGLVRGRASATTTDNILSKNTDNIGIVIEFDFLDDDQAKEILLRQTDIAKSILKALEEYYAIS